MNAPEAVKFMEETGEAVTLAPEATFPVFYKLCHGDRIMVLNQADCYNKITAVLEDVISVEQFVKKFASLKFYTFSL